jgi:predicted metal-dependent peptidase
MISKSYKAVEQARTNLLLDEVFWGSLSMRLIPIEDQSCDTFWTDGKYLGFNPKFDETLDMAERVGVVGHEVSHCAYGHVWRFPGAQPGFTEEECRYIWNEACDYEVNPILLRAGFRLPKGCLNDPKYEGKSAEEIFYILIKQYKQGGKKKGCFPGNGGFGEVRDSKTAPGDKAAEKQEWEQAVMQAAQAAQARGKLPKGLERLISDLRNPAIDWKAALRKFIEQSSRSDFSWAMPNRRYIAMGMYLPGLRSEQLPPIVVMGDSSGSLDDQESRKKISSEVVGIIQEARPEVTHWICGDEQYQCGADYQPDDPVDLKFKGGGGTSFRWAFSHVEEEGITPACFIGITDLMGEFPESPPQYPVLWVATTDCPAPFGEIVRIK